MFERLLSLGIRFRVILVALWAVIAIMGAISSINLESRLTTSLEVPKSGSQQAELILNQKFHEKSEGLITIINHFGTLSKADIEALKKKTSAATRIVPNSHLVQQQALAGTLFTVLASNSSLQQTSEYIEPLRSELKSRGLSNALVSGPPAIYSDVRPVLASDLRRGELIAVGFALILLIVALGFTWAVFIPLIFASTVVLFVL